MAALQDARRTAFRQAQEKGFEAAPWVFTGRSGGQGVDFRKVLAKAVVAAGVERRGAPIKLSPHVFRKAMATWYHVRGVSDALLQPRLGHAPGSRITSKTYVHVTTNDMRAVIIDLDQEWQARR